MYDMEKINALLGLRRGRCDVRPLAAFSFTVWRWPRAVHPLDGTRRADLWRLQ